MPVPMLDRNVLLGYKCHTEWDIPFGRQGLTQAPAQNFLWPKRHFIPSHNVHSNIPNEDISTIELTDTFCQLG